MKRLTPLTLIALTLGCRPATEEQAAAPPPPEVTVAPVVARAVIDYDTFTGRLEAAETVEVHARVRGYLNAVKFTDGQEVKAGDLLFEIDPRPFKAALDNAEGQKALWEARRDRAQSDVTRYEGLVPTGAASAQDLDKARAELGEAVAAIQSADANIEQAQLDLEFASITAPIDGQMGRALVTKGNLIQAGLGQAGLLTTIVSLDPIYVYFSVDERALLRFRDRDRASRGENAVQPAISNLKIPLYLGLSNDNGFPHEGVIDFADNRVDSSTGTIQVRGTFDNAKRLFKPGLFARVRIPTSEQYQAVLVSELALGTDQGRKYVYVIDDQRVAQKRFVELGPVQDDGLQVVTKGLKAGETIVVNGLQRVRPGKPVTAVAGEMPTFGVAASEPPAGGQPVADQERRSE